MAKKAARKPAGRLAKAVKSVRKKVAAVAARRKAAKPAARKAASAAKASPGGRKHVYFFGGGKADGRPQHARHARRQGRQPGGDDQRRSARAGRVHHFDRCLQHLLQEKARRFPPPSTARSASTCRGSRRRLASSSERSTNPLLVSVRSGAKFSMPGMMDTILNLGLNDEAVEGLKARTNNGRFAYDSYRRFIQMFGSVVLEIPKDAFEHEFEAVKNERGAKSDTDLNEAALRRCRRSFQARGQAEVGQRFSAGSEHPARDGA